MAMLRSLAATPFMATPPISMLPSLALSSPAMMFSSVDLPQPDGPTRIANSPLSISRSMPFSTAQRAVPLPDVANCQRRHAISQPPRSGRA